MGNQTGVLVSKRRELTVQREREGEGERDRVRETEREEREQGGHLTCKLHFSILQ